MTTKLESPPPSVLQTITDEFVSSFRMILGMAIIFAAGWLPMILAAHFARSFGIDRLTAAGVVWVATFPLFLVLERDFRLSRMLGMHVREDSSPLVSTLFLWAFGLAGLLLRSVGNTHPSVPAPTNIGATINGRQLAPVEKPSEEPVTKDSFREIVETVVFVVVLVLLLKTFVAEAFVIPTGSMAETLLGYQRFVTCSKCGHYFPVNCSSEIDPQQGDPIPVLGCTCPNCRYREVWREYEPPAARLKQVKEPPSWSSGDRVLVSKFPFDAGHLSAPKRFDVVVFKYPSEPQKSTIPMNYIKRLVGLPGETIAIYNGDLYVNKSLEYNDGKHAKPAESNALKLWQHGYTHLNDDAAVKAFNNREREKDGFEISRKPPDVMMAMRRIVYDNDHQASDLAGKAKPRWQSVERAGWSPDKADVPKLFRHVGGDADGEQWLRYKHLLIDRSSNNPQPPPFDVRPSLIRNFMGYNTGSNTSRGDGYWVSDLMMECTLDVEASAGEFVLELCKSADKFQARFELRTGKVTLTRVGEAKPFAESKDGPTKPGKYNLRFADFDDRLTLWVDEHLLFGDGVPVPGTPPQQEHPNNLDPAGVAVRGPVKLSVSHLRLWRDTFYTLYPEGNAVEGVQTRYVHPGHVMCMGDNSSESSDSRFWGMVPERLMLGRALVVYWPVPRAGLIR